MDDIDKILERLNDIERVFGLTGVLIAILMVVGFVVLWKFLLVSVESQAKVTYDKELSKFNKTLQEDLQKLNSNLEVLSAKETGNINEERQAILNYLDAYSRWLYGSLDIDILSYEYNNYEDINSVMKDIRSAHAECSKAWNKLKFWTDDEGLIKSSHELNTILLKYSQFHVETLSNLRHNLTWGKMFSDQFQKIIDKIDQMRELAEYFAEQDTKFRKKNEAVIKDFWEKRVELYSDVVAKNDTFQSIAREYLKK